MLSRKQIECSPEENLNAHAETNAKQKIGVYGIVPDVVSTLSNR
jgi:hypothetical protein